MDLFHRSDLSFLQTHLTQRMLSGICRPDPLPLSPVTLSCCRIPLILLIIMADYLLVFLAVSVICQIRTSGIRAWMFRLSRHSITFHLFHQISLDGCPFRINTCITKAPKVFPSEASLLSFSAESNIAQPPYAHPCSFLPFFRKKSSFAPRWWKNIRLTRLTTFMLW